MNPTCEFEIFAASAQHKRFCTSLMFLAALHLSLDGVPEDIDRQSVADWLEGRPGVNNVHDLHIWALSTTRTALAVHLVWQGEDRDAFIDAVTNDLERSFGIGHATLQLEVEPCRRASMCS